MVIRSSIQFFLKSILSFVFFNSVIIFSASGQYFSAIPVRGFTHDVIAEGTGRSSLAKTSLEMDAIDPSNYVLFTKQFALANHMPAGYGLPDKGGILKGDKAFILNAYNDKNALYLFRNQTGRLHLQRPQNYSRLSILGLATEGSAVLQITLRFTDSTTLDIRNEIFPDWFEGLNPFLSGFGRVKRADGSVARPLYFEGAPDNPGMYTINISSKPEKKLVYIQFRNVSPGTNRESNRAFIFAVSGFLVAPIEVKPAPIKEEIIPSEKKVPEEIRTTKPVEEKVIPITPKTFIIDGTVRDAKTEKPVRAIVNFIGTKTLSLSSDEDGLFSAEFPDLSEYTVKIEAAGYMGVTEKINLNQLPTRKMNVTMVPIEVGTLVKLNNILFEQSSPKLKEASFQELDQVADFLKNNPAVSIKLAGHTDNRGDRKLNLKLSKDRVAEVKKYLIMKGIDAGRITGQGYGGSKPIARGNNEEAWKLNRRVEFTITKM